MSTLQQAGALGKFYTYPSRRPWWNRKIWDAAGCCSDSSSPFFSVLRALFGYQDRPTVAELLAYAGYWAAALLAFRRREREAAASSAAAAAEVLQPQLFGSAAAASGNALEPVPPSGAAASETLGLLAGQQGRSSSGGAL